MFKHSQDLGLSDHMHLNIKSRKNNSNGARLRALTLAASLALLPGLSALADFTNTYNLGASGSGTFFEGGSYTNWLTQGTLPAGSVLKSVSINATLESTDNYNWAAELMVLFAIPGGSRLLEIGPDYLSLGSVQHSNWANGYADPPSTVKDTKYAGADFSAGIDLNTVAVSLVNGYGGPVTGGTWSGTVALTYGAPARNLTWTGGTSEWSTNPVTNWKDGATPTAYSDGDQATFDNSVGAGSRIVDISVADVSPAGVTFSNNLANPYTLTGIKAIAGSAGLTKQDNGLLIVGNVNTYSSLTRISAGTLRIGVANALPHGADKNIVLLDGTLDLNGFSTTLNGISGAGKVTSSAAGSVKLTLGDGDLDSNFTGVLEDGSGTLALEKIGSGTVKIAGGSSTYTGKTVVKAGTLDVYAPLTNAGVPGALGAPTGANAIIDLYNGVIFSSDEGASGPFHQASWSTNRALNLADNGTGTVSIRVNGNDTSFAFGGVMATGTGAKTLAISMGVAGNGDREVVTFNGPISDATDGSKVGLQVRFQTQTQSSNTLNINGQNTFSGPINLTIGAGNPTGTMRIGSTGLLGYTAPGVGNYTGDTSMVAGTILNYAGTGAQTVSGAISGDGALTMSGSGTLILAGANSYTGTTTVSGGVLRLSNPSALNGGIGAAGGSTSLIINGGVVELADGEFQRDLGTDVMQVRLTGGTSGFSAYGADRTVNFNGDAHEIQWGSANFAPANLVLNASTANGKLTLANPLDLNGATRTIAVNASTAEISGTVRTSTGTAGLTKIGAGTLRLSNANTYNGATTISGGKLAISPTGTINSTSNISIGAGEFTYDSGTALAVAPTFSATGGTLSGTGAITPLVTITGGNTLAPGDGGGTLTFNGGLALNTNAIAKVTNPGSSLAHINGDYTDSLGAHTLFVTGLATPGTAYPFIQWTGAAPGLSNGAQNNWSVAAIGGGLTKNWIGASTPDNWTTAASWDGTSGTVSADTTARNLSFALVTGGVPINVNDVVINPATSGIAVNGPASGPVVINSLQVGGSNNSSPALILGTGGFDVIGAVNVLGNGTLDATAGALVAPILNVSGAGATVTMGNASGNIPVANVNAGTFHANAGAIGTLNANGGATTLGGAGITTLTYAQTSGSFAANSGTIGAFNIGSTATVNPTIGAGVTITDAAINASGIAGTVGLGQTAAMHSLTVSGGAVSRTGDVNAGSNPFVSVTGGSLALAGSTPTATVTGGGISTTGGTIGTFNSNAGAGISTIGTSTTITTVANIRDGIVNFNTTQANGTLMVTGGIVNVGAGAKVTTANFAAGTGTVNTGGNALTITTQLSLSDSYSADYTAGASPTFTASGGNLADNNAVRTLSLAGGTLQLGKGGVSAGLDVRGWQGVCHVIDGSMFDMTSPNPAPNHSTYAGTIGYATESIDMNGTDQEHFGTGTHSGVPDSSPLRPTGYQNNYTIEYRGKLYIPSNSTYRFATTSDDGSALWIDQGNVSTANPSYATAAVQSAYDQGMTQRSSGQYTLSAGYHDFVVRFWENGGGNGIKVQWDPTGGTNFVAIPGTDYFHGGGNYQAVNLPNTNLAVSASSSLDLRNSSADHTLGALALSGGGTQLTVSGAQGVSFDNITGPGTVTNGGTADLTVTLRNGSGTLSGTFVDNGTNKISLVKDGPGTLTLSGDNSQYHGSTTVAGGTLALAAASGNNIGNTSAIAINGGATLDVTGLTSGALVLSQPLQAKGTGLATVNGAVNAGSHNIELQDGMNLSTLAVTGNLTIAGGGTFTFDLGDTSTNDKITVTGAATLNGTTTINVNALSTAGSLVTGTYPLITAAGGLSNSNFALSSNSLTIGSTIYSLTLSGDATHEYLGVALAAYDWKGTTTDWHDAGNWNNTKPGAGKMAVFADTGATTVLVELGNTDGVAGGLTFNSNVGGITIQSSGIGKLILDNGLANVLMDVTGMGHLITAPVSLNNNTQVTVNSSSELTISGVISGNASLTKKGDGTLVLGGANTNFTHSTSIEAGTLRTTNLYALGDPSKVLFAPFTAATVNVQSGGTLHVDVPGIKLASLTVDGKVTTTSLAAGGAGSTGNIELGTVDGSGNTVVAGTLTLGPRGLIDLQDRMLIVHYTQDSVAPSILDGPATAIKAALVQGRNVAPGGVFDGPWTGTAGITSSRAANDFSTAHIATGSPNTEFYALGYGDTGKRTLGDGTITNKMLINDAGPNFFDPTADGGRGAGVGSTVFVRYTRVGDATMDGIVGNNDVTVLGLNFDPTYNPAASPDGPKQWYDGDFNYNGIVDNNDVTILGLQFDPTNTTGVLYSSLVSQYGSSFASSFAQGYAMSHPTASLVPEPGALTLLGVGALALIRRRRA